MEESLFSFDVAISKIANYFKKIAKSSNGADIDYKRYQNRIPYENLLYLGKKHNKKISVTESMKKMISSQIDTQIYQTKYYFFLFLS